MGLVGRRRGKGFVKAMGIVDSFLDGVWELIGPVCGKCWNGYI